MRFLDVNIQVIVMFCLSNDNFSFFMINVK
jgi:hypothetical protein